MSEQVARFWRQRAYELTNEIGFSLKREGVDATPMLERVETLKETINHIIKEESE